MDAFKTLLLGTPPTRTYTASATGLLTSANNLSDVADAATSRTNLGLGTGNSPQFSSVGVGGAAPGSNGLKIFGTTASTSTTTGALQVAGGVGVAGAMFIGSNATIGNSSSQSLTVGSNSGIDASLVITNGRISSYYGGGVEPRFQINRDEGGAGLAGIAFGPGGATPVDSRLYRNGVSSIRTNSALTVDGNLTVSGTGTSSFGGVLSLSQSSGHAYVTGPTAAGKFLTLQSGNTTGGINFRDSAANEVAIYNQSTDKWTFAKPTTILGTTTNDNAATGYVGEYVSSTVGFGSRVSLTDGTFANVTSISLTAGDWDVQGNVQFEGAGATASRLSGGLSLTTAASDNDTQNFDSRISVTTTTGSIGGYATVTRRVSVNTTTTVYLIARGYFSAGTVGAWGFMGARRVR